MSHGPDAPPEIPEIDDERFRIVERIGAGGMGAVYKAIQKSVGRPVAIKVLSPEYAAKASGVARFVREARVISRLPHPHIVAVIDFGRAQNGNVLLVMELLDGETLRQTLRRYGRLGVPRAAGIAAQVLGALRVAHGAGIVHRDLKPENVFMCRVDGSDHVKVLDFGLAKLIDDPGDQTTAGARVGTVRYMAPEQIRGDAPNERVDLYSVGVLLYEMLSGALPYDETDRFKLARAVLDSAPVPLAVRAPQLAPALCELVMRAIAKDAARRFPSADEFRAALAPYLPRPGDPASVRPRANSSGPPSAGSSDGGATQVDRHRLAELMADAAASPERHDTQPEPPRGAPAAEPDRAARPGGRPAPARPARARAGGRLRWSTVAMALVGAAIGTTLVLAFGAWRDRSARSGAAVAPAAGTPASTVTVRTDPVGAEVRDAATGALLCPATPCAVAVPLGAPRRVALSHGGSTLEVLLEPGLPPVFVDLHTPGGAAASPPR